MPSAYRQFRWRCIQKILAGVAISLAGLALVFGDIGFGAVTIPQSTWIGAVIAVAGALYAVAAGLAWHGRSKPSVSEPSVPS